MPRTMFDLDKKDLRLLEKAYKKAPKKFARATAGMLNSYAFSTRISSIGIIHKRMTVRSAGFVNQAIRVQKAKGNIQPNDQFSIVGSRGLPRFSGWAEQELGTPDKRTRTATAFARGGDKKKKIKTGMRLKPTNSFRSSDDFPGKTAHHRSVAMLQIISREKDVTKQLIIKGHKRLPNGLYKIQRRKLRLVQRFDSPRKPIKRVRWHTGGVALMKRQTNMRDLWATNLKKAKLFR